MRLSVTQNKVEIVERSVVNQGEHQVTECEFDFVGAYDGLVKKAIFTDKATGTAYEMPIIDNACMIPADIAKTKGVCLVGVYAFDTFPDSEELVLRYSPTPATITIEAGSYKTNVENPSDITASQAEQYEAKINTKIEQVDAVISEVREKLANGEFQGQKGEDGKDGEKGEKGEDGQNGTNGQDGADGRSAYEVAVANGFAGSETEWLEHLKGKDGKDGANGADGKNGENGKDGADGKDGTDGFSPTINLEQIDETTVKITITNKDGSSKVAQFGGLWEDAEKEAY